MEKAAGSVQPGDIRPEEGGILEQAEDPLEDHYANFHGKSMDFRKERSTYTKAKKVKEGQHGRAHSMADPGPHFLPVGF